MTAKTEKQLVIILTIISINLSLILALSAYAERPVDTLEGVHEPFDQFTERLALSEQQAEQIRPILQESHEKMGCCETSTRQNLLPPPPDTPFPKSAKTCVRKQKRGSLPCSATGR